MKKKAKSPSQYIWYWKNELHKITYIKKKHFHSPRAAYSTHHSGNEAAAVGSIPVAVSKAASGKHIHPLGAALTHVNYRQQVITPSMTYRPNSSTLTLSLLACIRKTTNHGAKHTA